MLKNPFQTVDLYVNLHQTNAILKPLFYVLALSFLVFSCGGKAERKISTEEHPDGIEFTSYKTVKKRSASDNKKRVNYYNSLQHK